MRYHGDVFDPHTDPTLIPICDGCGDAEGDPVLEGMCEPCFVAWRRDVEENGELEPACPGCNSDAKASLDALCASCYAQVERDMRELDERTEHERRCLGCQTWFAPKDEQDYCDRCITMLRGLKLWCENCHVPMWADSKCRGCMDRDS